MNIFRPSNDDKTAAVFRTIMCKTQRHTDDGLSSKKILGNEKVIVSHSKMESIRTVSR